MPPARRTIGLASALTVVLGCVGLAIAFGRRTHPDVDAPPAGPSALVDTREHCDAIAASYRQALRGHQACSTDDDCMVEPRAKLVTGLDRCARFRRKDAPLADVDALEKVWLDRGCASSYLTCRQERAQCIHGTCAELPPDPLPRTYRRVWCQDSFSFFVPPDLIEEKVQGEDSVVGAFSNPKMHLSYDFGRYSNPLESENRDGGPIVDRMISRQEVTLSDAPAVLVTKEVFWTTRATPAFISGVHFPRVPVMGGGEGTRLTIMAICDDLADCARAEGIYRSIEFH